MTGGRPETNTANNTASATVLVTAKHTPPVVYCVAVSKVTPKQLFVGRKTTLTIHVTQHGKAKQGVHVLIKGPHFLKRTKASNAKGVIKQTVKMKKAGSDDLYPGRQQALQHQAHRCDGRLHAAGNRLSNPPEGCGRCPHPLSRAAFTRSERV